MRVSVRAALPLSLGVVLLLAPWATAEIFPIHSIPWYCHEADLIVEGRVLQGDTLRVDRVHKDETKAVAVGSTITVAGLGKHDRVVDRRSQGQSRALRTDRVVLFLRRDAKSKAWRPMATGAAPAQGLLGSAGMYWIEGNDVFAYEQLHSPGPLYLSRASSPYTLNEIRLATERGLRNSRAFNEALAIEDLPARARALAPYLLESTSPVGPDTTFRFSVRKPMAALGADALPVLMGMLKKRARSEDLREVIVILYDLGPIAKPAVPLLTALLDGPNKASNHYHAVAALRRIGDSSAIPVLRRTFERGDLSMASEAAEALAALGDHESFDRIAARLPTDPVSDDAYVIAALLEALQSLDAERARPHIERFAGLPAMENAKGRLRSLLRAYRKR